MEHRIYIRIESNVLLSRFVIEIIEACQNLLDVRFQNMATPNRRWNTVNVSRIEEIVSLPYGTLDFGLAERGCGLTVNWNSDKKAHAQVLSGSVQSAPERVIHFLRHICPMISCTYGIADDAKSTSCDPSHWFVGYHPITRQAVADLCWYNWFGSDYKDVLPITIEVPEDATLTRTSNGETELILAPSPHESRCRSCADKIAKVWPYFLRYDSAASFPYPIEPDYSKVRKGIHMEGMVTKSGFTLRLRRKLRRLGLLHATPKGRQTVPVILTKYCRMLDINVEEMVWIGIDREFAPMRAKGSCPFSETGVARFCETW